MQNLQIIKVALDQIQQHIDTALTLVARDSDNIRQYELSMKLREAQAAMLRVHNRLRTTIDYSNLRPTATSTPARPQTNVAPDSKATRKSYWCIDCRKHIRNDQFGTHMWHVHRIDVDGRTNDLARVAAELQQRDNDLYRDD